MVVRSHPASLPYAYAVLDTTPHYRAVAHETGVLQGLILVKRDSPYKTLRDLKGARVAFPSLYSYGATDPSFRLRTRRA